MAHGLRSVLGRIRSLVGADQKDAGAVARPVAQDVALDARRGGAAAEQMPASAWSAVHRAVLPTAPGTQPFPMPPAGSTAPLSAQLDAYTNSRSTTGNAVQLFIDGEQALPQVLAGLDGAKKAISYETYNFLPGDAVASEVADHLIAAANRGVKVRLVVDAIGSRELPLHHNATLQRLQAAGVQVKFYNPIDSLSDLIPKRDHRKEVLIDGTSAFLGGMNTGETFMGPASTPGRRHDLFARVQGPAVADVAADFVSSWEAAGGGPLSVGDLVVPPTAPPGAVTMRILEHTTGQDENIRAAYLAMIQSAKTSINVENSFPLAGDLAAALAAAAKRGVNVRYIVGSNEGLLGDAAQTRFQPLLDAGVRIYVYPTRVHTKALSVDGQACSFGSSNVDEVSLQRNREVVAMVEDPKFTAEFDSRLFDRDVVGDPQGQPTHQLPARLDLPLLARWRDAVLNSIWPKTLQ